MVYVKMAIFVATYSINRICSRNVKILETPRICISAIIIKGVSGDLHSLV